MPYKGGVNQYTIEPMSGYIDFASLQIFNVAPFVKQGKLRALAAGIKESRELFISRGQEPGGESGEQLTAFNRMEIERYEKTARTAGIPRQ